MLYKLLFNIGVWLRNPSLKSIYKFLLISDKWSKKQLEDYQLLKAKELLQYAYLNSSFYKNSFDKVGFNPFKMESINEMSIIPIIDKTEIISHKSEIQSKKGFKKLFFSETSGTSGQVLKFYRNEEWDSGTRAAMYRGYNWYGVRPWERNGYFWGYNFTKSEKKRTKLLDALQNRFRIFSYNQMTINNFCLKLQHASFISGYSSMIYEIAKIINNTPALFQKTYNLKMVKGTSEKIYDNYQDTVQKAFGKKLISEYGACETGIIAFECPEGGHMHLCMEHVIVEDINGEIVVTNLLSKSFPIIRYRLGDNIELADKNFECSCGRMHPVLLNINGRVGKNIYGYENKYPSLTIYYVFKNIAINNNISLNYQVEQHQKGIAIVKIEQNVPQNESLIKKELNTYFGNDISFEILFNQTLHTYKGKLKDFITSLE